MTPPTQPARQATVCCTAVAVLVVVFGVVAAINVLLAVTSVVWWPWLVTAACATAMGALLTTARSAHRAGVSPDRSRRRHDRSSAGTSRADRQPARATVAVLGVLPAAESVRTSMR